MGGSVRAMILKGFKTPDTSQIARALAALVAFTLNINIV